MHKDSKITISLSRTQLGYIKTEARDKDITIAELFRRFIDSRYNINKVVSPSYNIEKGKDNSKDEDDPFS